MRILACLLSVLVIPVGIVQSQELPSPGMHHPSPVRDPAAIATVQKAIDSLGGVQQIKKIHDCTATGKKRDSQLSQEISDFTWENEQSEFRYESVVSGKRYSFATGHGKPALKNPEGLAENISPLSVIADFPPHLPGLVLLRYFDNNKATIETLPAEDGTPAGAVRVRTSFVSDPKYLGIPPVVWTFDAATGRLLQVDCLMPEHRRPSRLHKFTIQYSDWRTIDSVSFPFAMIISREGILDSVLTLTSVQVNHGIDSSRFELKREGQ